MCFVIIDEIFPIKYLKSLSDTKLDVLVLGLAWVFVSSCHRKQNYFSLKRIGWNHFGSLRGHETLMKQPSVLPVTTKLASPWSWQLGLARKPFSLITWVVMIMMIIVIPTLSSLTKAYPCASSIKEFGKPLHALFYNTFITTLILHLNTFEHI